MGKLDQDLKNGGGFLLVASVSYNAYWVGDLWIQGTADAAFHYEAHSTSVA